MCKSVYDVGRDVGREVDVVMYVRVREVLLLCVGSLQLQEWKVVRTSLTSSKTNFMYVRFEFPQEKGRCLL